MIMEIVDNPEEEKIYLVLLLKNGDESPRFFICMDDGLPRPFFLFFTCFLESFSL